MSNGHLAKHELICYFLIHFFGPIVFVILLFSYFFWILITTVQANDSQALLPRHTILGFSIVLLIFAPVLLLAHWVFVHFDRIRHPYTGLIPKESELGNVAGTLLHSLSDIIFVLPLQFDCKDDEAIRDPDQLIIDSLNAVDINLEYQSARNSALQYGETTSRNALFCLDSIMLEPQAVNYSQDPAATPASLSRPGGDVHPHSSCMSQPCSEDSLIDERAERNFPFPRDSLFDGRTQHVHFDTTIIQTHRSAARVNDNDTRRWRAPADSRCLTEQSVRARKSLSWLRAKDSRDSDNGGFSPYSPYHSTRAPHSDSEREVWVRDGPI